MIFMKKIVSLLLFSAVFALGDEIQSVYYHESWRSEPYPYTLRPYYRSHDGLGSLRSPHFFDSSGDFDPSRAYIGLSYGYSYGTLYYPFYNSWWHGNSVYINIFPARYLNPVKDSGSPPIAGSAPLILKASEPDSPLELMLESFLNTTNHPSGQRESLNRNDLKEGAATAPPD